MKKFIIILFSLIALPCYSCEDITNIQGKDFKYVNSAIQCTLDEINTMNKNYKYEEQGMYWPNLWMAYEEYFEEGNPPKVLEGTYTTQDKLYKAIIKENVLYSLASAGLQLEDMGCEDGLTENYQQIVNRQISAFKDVQKLNIAEQITLAQRISLQVNAFKTKQLKFESREAYNQYICTLIGVMYNLNDNSKVFLAKQVYSLLQIGGTADVRPQIQKYILPLLVNQ